MGGIKRVLPESFEWVYVYIDEKLKTVGYVGRAKNAQRCARRICEHRSDNWYYNDIWKVVFIPCLNRFESEYIETLLINRYKAKYNIDKVDWGLPIDDEDTPLNDYLRRRATNIANERNLTITGNEYLLNQIERGLKDCMVQSGDWIEMEAV